MKPRRLLILATAITALAVPASAQAITVTGTAVPTQSLDAGAHSDFQVDVNFGPDVPSEDVKDLTVGLPPGVVADPSATPKCTAAELATASESSDGCPANTQVGAVTVNADITILVVPVNLNVTGKLYNFTPQPGEPARFAIVLQPGDLGGGVMLPLPPVILQSGAQLRQTDFGLNSIVNDIPNTTSGLPTHINSQQITLFGSRPWMSKPFARNPTSCTPKVTAFTAVPYTGSTGTGESPPFTPTNCGALDFSPTFSAKVTVPGAFTRGQKPTLTTVIEQDIGEAGMADAVVVVPPSIGPDLSQIVPEGVCPIPAFQASACPANTHIGTANATSPFLTAALTGPVVLVDNPLGTAKIGLDLHGELNMQIQGQLGLDNSNTFTGLPDIPIGRFELRFNNGPEGLLIANRDLCVPPPSIFHTNFVGYNGAARTGDTPATVEGCVPTKCTKKGKKKAKGKRGKKSDVAAAAKKKGKKKKKKACVKKKKRKKGKKRR